jgi:hypothetical protein
MLYTALFMRKDTEVDHTIYTMELDEDERQKELCMMPKCGVKAF